MDWGNAFVRRIEKNADGEVTEIGVELNLSGNVKKTKKKVTWLSALNDLVPLVLIHLDHVITVPKIEEGIDPLDHINPSSWNESVAWGDQNMRLVKKGELLQLNRKGYYICH